MGGTDIFEAVQVDVHARSSVAAASRREPGDALAVERVADEPVGLTVLGSAAALAVFAAWLAVALVDRWTAGGAWLGGLAATALVSWVLAGWWLSHGTGRPLVVLRRACLLGLVQWVALVMTHEPVALAQDGVARAVLVSESWLSPELSLTMVWVCLGGLLVTGLAEWRSSRAL